MPHTWQDGCELIECKGYHLKPVRVDMELKKRFFYYSIQANAVHTQKRNLYNMNRVFPISLHQEEEQGQLQGK